MESPIFESSEVLLCPDGRLLQPLTELSGHSEGKQRNTFQ